MKPGIQEAQADRQLGEVCRVERRPDREGGRFWHGLGGASHGVLLDVDADGQEGCMGCIRSGPLQRW